MKNIFEAEDGTQFDTQVECESHEKKNELLRHIKARCPETYCTHAGFDFSTVQDINDYIIEYFDEITEIVNRTKA